MGGKNCCHFCFEGEKGDPGLMGLPGLRGPPGMKVNTAVDFSESIFHCYFDCFSISSRG